MDCPEGTGGITRRQCVSIRKPPASVRLAQAADSMSMTITIAHTAKLFEVTNSSIFRTMKNSLTIGEVCASLGKPASNNTHSHSQESEFTGGDGSKTQMMTKVLSNGNIHCSGVMPKNSEKRMESEYWHSEEGSRLHMRMQVKSKDGTKELVNIHRQFMRKPK